MEKNLQVFNNEQFGQVRMVMVDGKPYAVGSDVAKALGYARPTKAIQDHCNGVLKRDITDSMGRTQSVSVIPQGDIIRLAVKCTLDGAERFESWIFDEVIPSVLNNGMYATDELLDNPDLLIKAGQKLKEEKEARLKAEAERAEAEKQQKLAEEEKRIAEHEKAEAEEILEKQKPKVEFYDDFMKAGETCSTTELAKYINQSMGLNTTATEVNKVLLALGVFNKRVARRWDEKTQKYKSTGKYILNKKFESKGWHKYVMNKDSKTGKNFTQTRWTNKGIHGVIQLFEVEREKLKLKYSA